MAITSSSAVLNSVSVNPSIMNSGKAKKARGRELAKLNDELHKLDCYENDVKNVMQDRKKFPSGKNARRRNKELQCLDDKRLALQVEMARLQTRA